MRWICLILCILLSGCADSQPSSQVDSTLPPVILGAVYNLSGSQESLDGPALKGAQLAVAQANQAGGVRGHRVELLVGDGKSDPAEVAARVRQLLASSPVALLGLSDTDMMRAAGPALKGSGRAFVTSGATSPLLPTEVPGVQLACFGDNTQAAAAAEYAFTTLGVRRIAIVYDSQLEYTRLLQTYFQTRFQQLGGVVVARAPYAGPAKLAGATQAVPTGVDLIFLAAGPDEALTGFSQLRQAGFSGPIMGGDSYDSADFGPAHPEVSQAFFTTHADLASQDPAVVAFVSNYRQAYPGGTGSTPTAFSALGYDAVNLILESLRNLPSWESATVLQSLRNTSNFAGITGVVSYTADSPGVPRKTVTVVAVQAGRRQVAARFVPQQIPAPATAFIP